MTLLYVEWDVKLYTLTHALLIMMSVIYQSATVAATDAEIIVVAMTVLSFAPYTHRVMLSKCFFILIASLHIFYLPLCTLC